MSGRDRPSWFDHAACAGINSDLFFPERGANDMVAAAKAVCAGCVVRSACLEYALVNFEHAGIWGGLVDRERRRVRRQRARRNAS